MTDGVRALAAILERAELGRTPGLAELTSELIRLDREYRAGPRAEPWPERYARELLALDGRA